MSKLLTGAEIALAFVLIAMTSTIHAEGDLESGWRAATLIESDNSGKAGCPQVAVDSSGNAIAVWHQSDTIRDNIWSNRYSSGSGWGTPTLIEFDNAGSARYPQVAVDGSGNAIAAWEQYDGARHNIWSNTYTSGSGWGTATLIESDNAGSALRPQVAVDGSGNAIAIWYQSDSIRDNIWSNRYTSGSGWGTATLIETDNMGTAILPQVAVDGSGNAVAVWYQSDGNRYNIWSNRYTSGSGWGTATLIESDNTGSASFSEVAVDGSGNAIAVWHQSDSIRTNIWANRYTSGSGWGTATLIETDNAGNAELAQVIFDSSGNAIAVWDQKAGTLFNIWSNRYTSGSGWGTPALIETDDTGSAVCPQVAIDGSGNAIAVWRQSDTIQDNIWSNRYTSGSGWGTPTLIETENAGDAIDPQVASNSAGNAFAVWSQFDGARANIWNNRYETPDNTPPSLYLDSPSNGTTTEVSAIKVSGTTEPGARLNINGILAYVEVDGSFSAMIPIVKGSNVLTVISTDGSGNSAVETRTVIYADPMEEELTSILGSLTLLNERIDGLSSSLLLIEQRTETIELDISSLDSDLNTVRDSFELSLSLLRNEIDSQNLNLTHSKENLTSLKDDLVSISDRLDQLEAEWNDTVNLSDIYEAIQQIESRLDAESSAISEIQEDVSSLTTDVDALEREGPEDNDDLEKEVNDLKALVTVLGAALFMTIVIGILLFIVLIVLTRKRRGGNIEE